MRMNRPYKKNTQRWRGTKVLFRTEKQTAPWMDYVCMALTTAAMTLILAVAWLNA